MSSGNESREQRGVSLERSLQWTLGVLVTLVLLGITGAGAWIGREAAIQFVASRLEHDAEAIIAAVDLNTGTLSSAGLQPAAVRTLFRRPARR